MSSYTMHQLVRTPQGIGRIVRVDIATETAKLDEALDSEMSIYLVHFENGAGDRWFTERALLKRSL